MNIHTLNELLRKNINSHHTGITFIESSHQEIFLSYADLYKEATKALAVLQEAGMHIGDQLVLQIADNRSFIIGFWAALLGGYVPVPLAASQNPTQKQKLFNVWEILHRPFLLINDIELNELKAFAKENNYFQNYLAMERRTISEEKLLSSVSEGKLAIVQGKDIAFVQFSSGSTGLPKGVILTHENLIANIEGIANAASYGKDDRLLSWMPLTHDMGLIGFHLNPLYSGINQYLMPTNLFVRRPNLWLSKATEHHITVLCSPNFGYEYLLKYLSGLGEQDWDLSKVRIIYNGAEPISFSLCMRFIETLGKYGLSSKAMCPVYGLAEASVAVAMSAIDHEIIVVRLHRNHLNQGNVIKIVEETEDAVSFVNVGKAIDHCLLRIANDNDQVVPESVIGEVHIKGGNVTKGYYNNINESLAVKTADGWVRTGDLGFLLNSSLYITGRKKDVFFINGQNYYPHDIERVAEESAGFELNKIAIAGWFNNTTQQEEVIAFVAHRGSMDSFIPLKKQLKTVINTRTGLLIDRVIPIKQVPKTTSGKLQRFRLIERLRDGDFEKIEQELQDAVNNTESNIRVDTSLYSTVEKQLLALYEQVLGVEGMDIDDSFFEFGGNSLNSIELSMCMLKIFEIELPLKILYKKPTVRLLAAVIDQLKKQAYHPLKPAVKQDFYPVGSAQRRLYYAWEIDKESTAYNVPVCIEIKGEINIDKLAECVRQLIARHEVLRMSFHRVIEPVCTIAESVEFELFVLNSTAKDVDNLLLHQVKPFNLNSGSLFRLVLVKIEHSRYILFTDFHHIISDGISTSIFIKELLELYGGEDLVDLPVNYTDFTCWEKTGEMDNNKAEVYWKQQLQEPLPVLELPTRRKRPAVFEDKGLHKSFRFDEPTTDALKQLADTYGCSLHVLLLTLYYILLYKYSGNEDLIVGIAVAGRRHPDIQALMGMFVNNLAIREQVNGEQKFAELLKNVDRTMDDALEYQDYSFDKLVKLVDTRQETGRSPIFDTMFLFQHFHIPEIAVSNLECCIYPFNAVSAKFDLSLELKVTGQELDCKFEYAQSLFDENFVEDLRRGFVCLAHQVISNSNQTVAALSVLDGHEYHEIIYLFNQTERVFSKGKTVHQLFEEQVQRTPNAIAIEHNGQKINYEQLNKQADEMASLLCSKGVGPGSITVLLLPRGTDLVVGILGVLKAGAAYLPIDTELPEARIRFIIEDSKSFHLVTNRDLSEKWQLNEIPDITILYVDAPEDGNFSLSLSKKDAKDNNLAYLIYTSGTTGNPKGVMVYHYSLVNYVSWASKTYLKEEGMVFPLFTSISFDLTVTSIFTPLITGNCILIYDEADGEVLIEKILSDNRSDIIKLTPSHLRIIAAGKSRLQDKIRIKRFIVGGEQLNTSLAKTICNKLGNAVEIYNEYGPTEATVGCMVHLFSRNETSEIVPIGLPAANTWIYLLDKHLNPVPTGVPGEIYISGNVLAKGYLDNPVLTDEKFISNPFCEGRLMYKTGDIARRLTNGVIEYIGRKDQQVKINGYRIELREIEINIINYQYIKESVVVLKQLENGSKILCAYYTSSESVSTNDLYNYLASRLPSYMLPVHFMQLEQIPLTHNAKIDYDSLPEPIAKLPVQYRMPVSETEQIMLQVWRDILGASVKSVSDNFFQLGGDSIKAVQITSRLLEKGIIVKVRDILTKYTIAQISPYAVFATEQTPYAQGIIDGAKSLTPIEHWFFAQHLKNPDYYNQSVLLMLKRALPVHILENAFEKIIEIHDELRINYDLAKQETFYNKEHLGKRFVIAIYQSPTEDISEICEALRNKSDITNDFLLNAALIQVPNGQKYLFITAHHLIVDGISWRILLEDLYTSCIALEKGSQILLPKKTASLLEWQKALIAYSESKDYIKAESFWADQEPDVFALPIEQDTNDWRCRNRKKIQLQLDETTTSLLLKDANLVYETDTSMLLNAALAMTLKEWTGSIDIIIEQENHGRHLDINVSRTIGWFTTIYPLHFKLTDDHPEACLRTVKAAFVDEPDQGIAYGIYRGKPDVSHSAKITPVRLNYLGQFDDEFDNELFKFSNLLTGSETDLENNLSAALEINAMVRQGKLYLEFCYNSKSFKDSTMSWLTDLFKQKLEILQNHLSAELDLNKVQTFFGTGLDEQDLNELFN